MVDINNKKSIVLLYEDVRTHLLNAVLSFWYEHTRDTVNGGYTTALDRTGKPLKSERQKNIWMQARQIWMFSRIYMDIEHDEKCLNLAEHGCVFLLSSAAYAGNGRWNYLLSEDGTQVLKGSISIFTDAFVLMALCAYAEAVQKKAAGINGTAPANKAVGKISQPPAELAELIEDTFVALVHNMSDENFQDIFPHVYRKGIVHHGIYMICMNALSEASGIIGYKRTDPYIRFCLDKLFCIIKAPDAHYFLEYKYADGCILEENSGCILNPGHNFESLWFILKEVQRLKLDAYYREAVNMLYTVWELAKDRQYGGVVYMLDTRLRVPSLQDWNKERNLQWNEKVWWTHAEALCALAAYMCVQSDQKLADEFERLWRYCLEHFWDKDYNEWYSVLHADGSVRIDNKGGLQKAAFHIPRSLYSICLFLKEKESSFV